MQRLAAVARKRAGLGYRLLRQMILSARKGEDRIRLTASPKSFLPEEVEVVAPRQLRPRPAGGWVAHATVAGLEARP